MWANVGKSTFEELAPACTLKGFTQKCVFCQYERIATKDKKLDNCQGLSMLCFAPGQDGKKHGWWRKQWRPILDAVSRTRCPNLKVPIQATVHNISALQLMGWTRLLKGSIVCSSVQGEAGVVLCFPQWNNLWLLSMYKSVVAMVTWLNGLEAFIEVSLHFVVYRNDWMKGSWRPWANTNRPQR